MNEKLLELFSAGVMLAVTVYQAAKGKPKPYQPPKKPPSYQS